MLVAAVVVPTPPLFDTMAIIFPHCLMPASAPVSFCIMKPRLDWNIIQIDSLPISFKNSQTRLLG